MPVKKGTKNIKNTRAYKLGNSGENKVVLTLNTFMRSEQILHDIMLVDETGGTHQIDVIAVTSAGVFVIEVKNVCGIKIRCENNWTYWTYDWIKNHEVVHCRLYNPIMQNSTHVKEIRKLIGNDYPIYSMITFANNNILVHENPLDEMVVPLDKIKKYFELFPRHKISSAEMKYIRETIINNNHTEISLQEHIDNIKRS